MKSLGIFLHFGFINRFTFRKWGSLFGTWLCRARKLLKGFIGLAFFGSLPCSVWASSSFELSPLSIRDTEKSAERAKSLKIESARLGRSQNLYEFLNQQSGLEAQITCAFCGSKRLTINGHRGEHTTILVDGLSLHSSVSSFYGLDSISLLGIEQVDVYRGASLTGIWPEGLAGVLNIRTREVDYYQSDLWFEFNQRQEAQLNFMQTLPIGDHWGLIWGGQSSSRQAWDVDDNGVAELPHQGFQSYWLKAQFRPNQRHTWALRHQGGRVVNRGGLVESHELSAAPEELAQQEDFEDRDVRRHYIGNPLSLQDQVHLQRQEYALTYQGLLDSGYQIEAGLGHAFQRLDAIYSHGYDYRNKDQVSQARAQLGREVSSHGHRSQWWWGWDYKEHQMDSQSDYLYGVLSLRPDSFQQRQGGVFSQWVWEPKADHVLDITLRAVQLESQWVKMNETRQASLLVPKVVYNLNPQGLWQQRWSWGKGYRSPLSLFESQHGTDHYGFEVALDQIETSDQWAYLIRYQDVDRFVEANVSLSRLYNMAYGWDRAISEEPTLFVNAKETFDIWSYDLQWGWQTRQGQQWQWRLDYVQFSDAYAQKLPVASQELRAQIEYSLKWRGWTFQSLWNGVGARSLSRYAEYRNHYNQVNAITDPSDENFPMVTGQAPKRQTAPAFFTWDLMARWVVSDVLQLSFGVLNVLDYTQYSVKDGPLTWHIHGNHYHLDNFHLWGPLRGREYMARLQYSF